MRILLTNICLIGLGFIAATLIQELLKEKIIESNNLREKKLIKEMTKLNIRLDRQKTFIEKQTNIIDKLKWKNSENSICNHKIEQYRRKQW